MPHPRSSSRAPEARGDPEKNLTPWNDIIRLVQGWALLHNSQAVDKKNEFLWHFYNNFRLSQGQLKTYATTPQG
jgi:hypothetical protein